MQHLSVFERAKTRRFEAVVCLASLYSAVIAILSDAQFVIAASILLVSLGLSISYCVYYKEAIKGNAFTFASLLLMAGVFPEAFQGNEGGSMTLMSILYSGYFGILGLYFESPVMLLIAFGQMLSMKLPVSSPLKIQMEILQFFIAYLLLFKGYRIWRKKRDVSRQAA